jgi:FAD:protein FMN transferase
MRARSVRGSGVAVALLASMSCHDDGTSGTSPVPSVPTVSTSAAALPTSGSASRAPVAAFVPQRIVDNDGHAMGTHLAFTAFTTPANDETKVRAAFAAATDEIRRLEAMMTTWRPDSELSKVN